MMQGEHIPQEDLVLYAMQSLSAEELAAVRLHLEECKPCRDELAAVSGDLALVALSVEQHPLPEGARRRFIERSAADSKAAQAGAKTPEVAVDARRTVGGAAVLSPRVGAAVLRMMAVLL